jgi:hypothetical protein
VVEVPATSVIASGDWTRQKPTVSAALHAPFEQMSGAQSTGSGAYAHVGVPPGEEHVPSAAYVTAELP